MKTKEPQVGEVEPWRILGWLQATIESKGTITKTDWNNAVEAAEQGYRRVMAATGTDG